MYYGQTQEDKKIRELLGENDPGFYIDIGAYHPDTDSITKHFYDRGWNGINVEPVRQLLDKFVISRTRDINICQAVGMKKELTKIKVICDEYKITGLTSLHKENSNKGCEGRNSYEQDVVIDTLENLCDNFVKDKQIDFLKIDVEGFEKEVIYSGNWAKYRPKVLCIEATIPCTTIKCDSWNGYVQSICKYNFVHFDGLNNFYIRKEGW